MLLWSFHIYAQLRLLRTLTRICRHFDEISSLDALEVVILTTFGVAINENFIKMTAFPFQWKWRVSKNSSEFVMMTSSNGNFFRANSPVTGEFPAQRPVTRSFDVSFDLRLNKRLSKQSWGWWFETPLRSLWRHCNGLRISKHMYNHTYTLTHAYSETVCRYFFAKFLSVADVVDVWYKWYERDHSKCTGWVVLNFGKHAGCDSAPIWLTFQGLASKVKVAANAALGLANHWHWVIILLPQCQWNGTKRYG